MDLARRIFEAARAARAAAALRELMMKDPA
jgi:hypothetical protein